MFAVPLIMMMAMTEEEPFFGAAWLRDPVFANVAIQDRHTRGKAPDADASGPQNVHTFFRKEVPVEGPVEKAEIRVTGDDYYKLYINGAFVVQGPEPGYPWAHPYYTLDVTEYLREGVNCIAAHVYYQGLVNRVWDSGDNRSGFILSLGVTRGDGTTARTTTDATWTCWPCPAYGSDHTFGYQTQFNENIDMRLLPQGWKEVGFDDASWSAPLVQRQDHVFVEQHTPPLQHWRAEAVETKQMDDGTWWYDFGHELTGSPHIRLKGKEGHRLEVRQAEELEGGRARYTMRANCVYQDFPILREGDNEIAFFDYRGFRYLEVLNAPSRPEVWVDVRHHPYPEQGASLASSHELLDRIFTLCANGVRYGSQGGFLDCPTREKGQYLGDAVIASRSHLVLTGDGSLTRKALHDFRESQKIHPGMMAVAPGSFLQEIAEFGLQWPLMLATYYWETGDRAFTETMLDGLAPLYEYYATFENEHGLLTGMTEKWVVVDWPANLRDDYDYDFAKDKENAVLNAFYYGSLVTSAELLTALGRSPEPYASRAERVKAGFQSRMLDRTTGLFLDAPGSAHSSLHANAIPLCFGLVEKAHVPRVLEFIRAKRLNCGVYIAAYVIEGCYRAGADDLAYDLITSTDEHSWHEMLKHGATTCMEAWGPDKKRNSSWCHPWSSSPVYLVNDWVVGLRPTKPGWAEAKVAPHIPESITHFTYRRPTPRGLITISYRKGEALKVDAPASVAIVR